MGFTYKYLSKVENTGEIYVKRHISFASINVYISTYAFLYFYNKISVAKTNTSEVLLPLSISKQRRFDLYKSCYLHPSFVMCYSNYTNSYLLPFFYLFKLPELSLFTWFEECIFILYLYTEDISKTKLFFLI